MIVHSDVPNPARIYDYFLGGKDTYYPDRAAAEQVLKVFPAAPVTARTNRDFMQRATRFLAGQGLSQFLDIGTGIPTRDSPNLHQVAQEGVPYARVVYVDNDPFVLMHARALMVSSWEGRLAYVEADAADPAAILAAPQLRGLLDLTQPVAVSLMALLHFVPGDVYEIVKALMEPLAPGSYLAMSHMTTDFDEGPQDPDAMARLVQVYLNSGIALCPRSRAEVSRLFDGLELLEPGVEVIHRWRNEGIKHPAGRDKEVSMWGAIGRKN